jgi:hypothetical protein
MLMVVCDSANVWAMRLVLVGQADQIKGCLKAGDDVLEKTGRSLGLEGRGTDWEYSTPPPNGGISEE